MSCCFQMFEHLCYHNRFIRALHFCCWWNYECILQNWPLWKWINLCICPSIIYMNISLVDSDPSSTYKFYAKSHVKCCIICNVTLLQIMENVWKEKKWLEQRRIYSSWGHFSSLLKNQKFLFQTPKRPIFDSQRFLTSKTFFKWSCRQDPHFWNHKVC